MGLLESEDDSARRSMDSLGWELGDQEKEENWGWFNYYLIFHRSLKKREIFP